MTRVDIIIIKLDIRDLMLAVGGLNDRLNPHGPMRGRITATGVASVPVIHCNHYSHVYPSNLFP